MLVFSLLYLPGITETLDMRDASETVEFLPEQGRCSPWLHAFGKNVFYAYAYSAEQHRPPLNIMGAQVYHLLCIEACTMIKVVRVEHHPSNARVNSARSRAPLPAMHPTCPDLT